MNTLVVVLAAALVSFVLVPVVLRFVFARFLGRVVGGRALAKQPDTIHLMPATPGVWTDPASQASIASALQSEGFRDAGTYTIGELPGVVTRLLVHEPDALRAMIYEHPRAGRWLELVCRYLDGAGASFSTHPPSGLDPLPRFLRVNAPGAEPAALLGRMRKERPPGPFRPVRLGDAARDFEAAWAEGMAIHKQRGVSGREVANVAVRMKLKKSA